MNGLDYIILGLAVLFALLGYMQGFIVALASLLGLMLGGVVGIRASQALLERGAASEYAPLIGLGVALLITVVGSMAMQDIGAAIRSRIHLEEHIAVDRVLGSVLLAIVSLLLVWFSAAASIGLSQTRQWRPQIVGSTILQKMNSLLPPTGPVLGLIASYDPFPAFDGPRIDIEEPDPRLPKDPEVRAASRGVVRVSGTACGYRITGSGWVAARGYVVTNAHVVAGSSDTEVQSRTEDDGHGADVVAFDTVNDLAVLRVPDLEIAPLELVPAEPKRGTAGAVLGYPESGPFTSTPARYSDERDVRADDLYGRRKVTRPVTSVRGTIRHGNSGGPMVDGTGRVVTTIFAATVGEGAKGGYGIPNDIVVDAVNGSFEVPSDVRLATRGCIE